MHLLCHVNILQPYTCTFHSWASVSFRAVLIFQRHQSFEEVAVCDQGCPSSYEAPMTWTFVWIPVWDASQSWPCFSVTLSQDIKLNEEFLTTQAPTERYLVSTSAWMMMFPYKVKLKSIKNSDDQNLDIQLMFVGAIIMQHNWLICWLSHKTQLGTAQWPWWHNHWQWGGNIW